MVDAIHRFDLAGMGASRMRMRRGQFEKAPLEDILQMTFPVDPKLKDQGARAGAGHGFPACR